MEWKKGRGKLGVFQNLLGAWVAESDSEMGPVKCRREFTRVLDGKYIQLKARWEYGENIYDELALIGVNAEKDVCFWSFTSDGKQSDGKLADLTELHPQAVGFVAEMPAGLGRQAYWPEDQDGFHWVVEAKPKKNWDAFCRAPLPPGRRLSGQTGPDSLLIHRDLGLVFGGAFPDDQEIYPCDNPNQEDCAAH